MLRTGVCLLIYILVWHLAAAQEQCTGSFSGDVMDTAGNALIGATVLFPDEQHGTATDYNGRYLFEHVCPGTYPVTVLYVGYKKLHLEITMDDQAIHHFVLEEAPSQLEEVTVQEKAAGTENAQNFVTLSGKQLQESAGKTIGETLTEIPGVNTIQTGPGIFKPVIHGVHSQRILILNYGIPQEGQQWGAEHAPEIDPFIASNIVVIKDASAIKYGSDALGGVVVINPPPLPTEPGLGGTVNTVLQSNGRSGTLSGELEGGLKNHEGFGWRVQGTLKRSGDFSTPDYQLTNTGIKEADFSAATGYHKDNYGVEVFFSHFESELGILKGTSIGNINDLILAMEREPPQYTEPFSYDIGEPRQDISHNLLKVNAHLQSEKSKWRLQYGFQNDHRQEFDIRYGAYSDKPILNLQLNSHTLDAEWESSFNSRLSTCFGLTGMFQDNNNVHGTLRIPFIPNFSSASTGAFGVADLSLDRWTIDLGLRYDFRYYDVAGYDFKNTLYKTNLQFHNASGTAGATYHLDKNQSVKLNVSTAWRPPHVSELYSIGRHQSAAAIEYGLLLNDTTNEVLDINEASFKTEQAVKTVGSYAIQTPNISLEATVYANFIANYIYLQPRGITQQVSGTYPYFRYTQTDALFLGTDFSANWNLGSHLAAMPRVSILRAADVKNNDYLVYIPSNHYEAALRYHSNLGAFSEAFFELKGRYTTRQNRAPRYIPAKEFLDSQADGSDPLGGDQSNFDFQPAPDSYWLIGASAGCSLMGKDSKLDFRLFVENVTNTEYREYTNRFRYYADDLGRNFGVSIKYAF